MTTLREAAQQALVDMACVRDMVAHPDNLQFIDKAITALRAALEQPDRAQRMRDAQHTRRPTLREMSEPKQPEQENEMQKMLRSLGFDAQCPESIGITLRRWKDGYAAALEQSEQEPVADSFTMDELTEAAVYAEIPDGPFQSLLIGLQEAVKQRAALKERNA